jgi:hypothetical protein
MTVGGRSVRQSKLCRPGNPRARVTSSPCTKLGTFLFTAPPAVANPGSRAVLMLSLSCASLSIPGLLGGWIHCPWPPPAAFVPCHCKPGTSSIRLTHPMVMPPSLSCAQQRSGTRTKPGTALTPLRISNDCHILVGLQRRVATSLSSFSLSLRLPHAPANLLAVNHLILRMGKVMESGNDWWPPMFSMASRWDCGIACV